MTGVRFAETSCEDGEAVKSEFARLLAVVKEDVDARTRASSGK